MGHRFLPHLLGRWHRTTSAPRLARSRHRSPSVSERGLGTLPLSVTRHWSFVIRCYAISSRSTS
jgi:hypothetical protein